MSIAPSPALTPEELLLMPDEGQGIELVHGELRERNVRLRSSRIAGQIVFYIQSLARASDLGWVFGPGLGYRCFTDDLNRVRRADASFIALDRMPLAAYEDEGHTTTVPDLVAEVVSPNDLSHEVDEKRDEWLAAGVKIVWVVTPGVDTVEVYRQDGGHDFLRINDTLTAEGVLPGFSCPVADLFRRPGEPAAT